MHLTRDLGRILAWDARLLAALHLLKQPYHATPTRTELASVFEQRMGSYIRITQECLSYLEQVVNSYENGGEARSQ